MAQENPGLHVPPEQDPHELTFMQWPVSRQVYRGRRFLQDIQQTIVDIANTIAEFEPVVMLDVDRLGEAGGGIHCATQQMPAA